MGEVSERWSHPNSEVYLGLCACLQVGKMVWPGGVALPAALLAAASEPRAEGPRADCVEATQRRLILQTERVPVIEVCIQVF